MKRHFNRNASEQLHIRISPEDKEHIRKMVEKNGLSSISEFILLSIKKIPIEDKKHKQEFSIPSANPMLLKSCRCCTFAL